VRSDEKLPDVFRDDKTWATDPETGAAAPQLERLTYHYGPDYHRHSYSGYERNKLFLNTGDGSFEDRSALSGADNIADSRSWAALDYDGDGWTDIALVNSNAPLLNLYRNRIGDDSANKSIKVKLVGGARPDDRDGWSNRDAVGAVVEIEGNGLALRRIRQLGEGYAAQNSATLTIGIGEANAAESIKVTWPSGRTTTLQKPTLAGSSITIQERP
jgi:hypothetical protein